MEVKCLAGKQVIYGTVYKLLIFFDELLRCFSSASSALFLLLPSAAVNTVEFLHLQKSDLKSGKKKKPSEDENESLCLLNKWQGF